MNDETRTLAALRTDAPVSVRERASRTRTALARAVSIGRRSSAEASASAEAASLPRRSARAATIALCAVFIAHLGIALVVSANHEPWRDEADIWLFGRDAPPQDWWSFLRHSGHPGLWHLVVTGLTSLRLPYASMNYLNVGIVSVGIAIFLRRALLPLPLKLLLPFGVYPLFEYGVVARSYGLSLTLAMAACASLASRKPRPALTGLLLALLANTNFHSLILATGFGIYWLFDRLRERAPGTPILSRSDWLGMSIAVVGGLACVVQVLPPDDPQVATWTAKPMRILAGALTDAFFPRAGRSWGGYLGLALLGLCVPLMRRRRELLAFLLASVGGLILVFLLVYPPYPRHAAFLWIAVTCVLWLERRGQAPSTRWRSGVTALFALSLGFSAVEGIRLCVLDYRKPFSASRDGAEFLRTLDLDSAIVAAHPCTMGEAILPYLPIQNLYYPGIQMMGSYLHWDAAYWLGVHVEDCAALERTRLVFPEPRPLVFITTTALDEPEASGLTLRHRTATPPAAFKEDEHYFIYTSAGVSLNSAP